MNSKEILSDRNKSFESFTFQRWSVYKKSVSLCKTILRLSPRCSKIGLPNLADQLKRAVTSIPLNISEGYSRCTTKDKQTFLRVAQGSVYEIVSIIDILKDSNGLNIEEYADVYTELSEIGKMISALINHLEKVGGRYRKWGFTLMLTSMLTLT